MVTASSFTAVILSRPSSDRFWEEVMVEELAVVAGGGILWGFPGMTNLKILSFGRLNESEFRANFKTIPMYLKAESNQSFKPSAVLVF